MVYWDLSFPKVVSKDGGKNAFEEECFEGAVIDKRGKHDSEGEEVSLLKSDQRSWVTAQSRKMWTVFAL